LLVVSASQAVRFSAKIADDQLIEEPPEPGTMQFLASTATTGFANDQWIVARPIISHASPASMLGWVVVTRSVSAAVVARLARSVSGSLIAHPLRGFDAATLPADLLTPAANRIAESFDVTTHLSRDNASGYAPACFLGTVRTWSNCSNIRTRRCTKRRIAAGTTFKCSARS
jgi:hypothetical protein